MEDFMSKKHRLLILAGLFIISGIWGAGIEWAKAYAVCRNEMLSVEGYGVWKLRNSSLVLPGDSFIPKPGIHFTFYDGTNRAGCAAFRDQAGWHKNGDGFST